MILAAVVLVVLLIAGILVTLLSVELASALRDGEVVHVGVTIAGVLAVVIAAGTFLGLLIPIPT